MIKIPVPLYTSSKVFAWSKVGTTAISSVEHLDKYRIVATFTSAYSESLFRNHSGEFSTVSSHEIAIEMVQSGRVDYVILSDYLMSIAKSEGLGEGLVKNSPSLFESWAYHFVNEEHSNLVDLLSIHLEDMSTNGYFQLAN